MDNLRDDDLDLSQRGDENVAKGGMDKVTGKVEEGWGKLTGNRKTEAEGKMRQAGGSVREGVGNVERNLDDMSDREEDREYNPGSGIGATPEEDREYNPGSDTGYAREYEHDI